jgi:hypothetical protein
MMNIHQYAPIVWEKERTQYAHGRPIPKILITRREDVALDIQNGNSREMHYGHFARKPKHVGMVSVQYIQ